MTRSRRGSAVSALAVVAVAALMLSSCAPEEGGATPSPTLTSSPSPTAGSDDTGHAVATPSPQPSPDGTAGSTPEPTATPDAGVIALPTSCESIYSPGRLAELQRDAPPLNDPGLSMSASGVEEAVEALDSLQEAGMSLRCTWGTPSEWGLATHVSTVTASEAALLQEAFVAQGLDCSDMNGGTMCRIVVAPGPDDEFMDHSYGETHFFRSGTWIATAWLNFGPEGYTTDIIDTLWS